MTNKTESIIKIICMIVCLIGIVVILACFVRVSNIGGSSSSSKTVECQWCDQDYSKGTENAKSISRTGMCKKCYNSYKAIQDAVGE